MKESGKPLPAGETLNRDAKELEGEKVGRGEGETAAAKTPSDAVGLQQDLKSIEKDK